MRRLLVCVAALAAVSTTSYAQERNLRIVVPQEPPELEICSMGSSAPARVLFGNVGEGLTQRDPVGGGVLPLLALEWNQTSPTTWVFKLREGVKFHDGSPFNASTAATAFARTFKKELSCANATQAFGSVGVSAKVLGDYELELTTMQPDPILPLRVSFIGMTGPNTDPDKRSNSPVGTGPYKATTWQRGTNLVLEPFADYWGEAGQATRVTYIFRSEDLVRAEMIGAGEADIAVGLPAEFSTMEYAIAYPVPETTGLRFHMQSKPFDDRRVREAVVYALDREGLISAIWGGVGEPAGQPITQDVLGFNPDIGPAPYDPDRARALVAEAKAAGVAVDTPSKIFTRLDVLDNADLLAQAIAQQLNDVGLNVGVEVMEAAPWIDLLRVHPTDRPGFLLEPHNNLLGDASWTTNSKYHSRSGRSQNRGETAVVADKMIEDAGAATGDERQRLYRELMSYLSQDIITDAFIAHTNAVMSVGPKVDYTPNAMSNDIVRVTEITFKE